jgi:cation transport ATPase
MAGVSVGYDRPASELREARVIEDGAPRARGALTTALIWAAAIVYLAAIGALAYLGADPVWWAGALLVVIVVGAIGRRVAPPGFTEAQKAKQPDRRTLPRLAAFVLLVMVVAGVLGYLGAMRG